MRVYIYMIFIFNLMACNEWVEYPKEKLLLDPSLNAIFSSTDHIGEIKRHLDNETLQFVVTDFKSTRLKEIEAIAINRGWCTVHKLDYKIAILAEGTETFSNGTLLTITVNESDNTAYITVHNQI
jgi:hypothetical protein